MTQWRGALGRGNIWSMGKLIGWGFVLFVAGAIGDAYETEIRDLMSWRERKARETEVLKKSACRYWTADYDDYSACRARLELDLR